MHRPRILTYQKKISGPFLDRIDLQIKVKQVALKELRADVEGSSEVTLQRGWFWRHEISAGVVRKDGGWRKALHQHRSGRMADRARRGP